MADDRNDEDRRKKPEAQIETAFSDEEAAKLWASDEDDEAAVAQDQPRPTLLGPGCISYRWPDRNAVPVLVPVPRFQVGSSAETQPMQLQPSSSSSSDQHQESAIMQAEDSLNPSPSVPGVQSSMPVQEPGAPHAHQANIAPGALAAQSKEIGSSSAPGDLAAQSQQLGPSSFSGDYVAPHLPAVSSFQENSAAQGMSAQQQLIQLGSSNVAGKYVSGYSPPVPGPSGPEEPAATHKRKAVALEGMPDQPQELESGSFYGDYVPPDRPPVQILQDLIGKCSKPFEKQFVGRNMMRGELSMLKDDVNEHIRPMLNADDGDPFKGFEVTVYDIEGKPYKMKFRTPDGDSDYLNGEDFQRFCEDHNLEVNRDFITFWAFRHAITERLCFVVNSRKFDVFQPLQVKK